DLAGKEDLDLTPLKKVRAQIQDVSHKFPGEILIALNDRTPQFHDVYRLNLETGKRELVEKNDEFSGFITDDDYRVRFATKFAADPRADAGGAMLHPTEHTIEAVSFTYDRTRWTFKDAAVEADFKKLGKVADGDITVASRTLDDKTWIVAFLMDNGPTRFYL